ncbi:hypothetical protein [Arthrobacter sp. IK3]|uniref:hypothetical protein n=1 Tax=Arthrobacter sp. IK3 TaxID=3448169 RepID=UPI003EE2DF37
MNFILFTAVCLAAVIPLSLLAVLPAGIPGRRRTLEALARAEEGAADRDDLALLVHGHAHPVFFRLRRFRGRIAAQCERLFDDLGVPREDMGWVPSRSLVTLR